MVPCHRAASKLGSTAVIRSVRDAHHHGRRRKRGTGPLLLPPHPRRVAPRLEQLRDPQAIADGSNVSIEVHIAASIENVNFHTEEK